MRALSIVTFDMMVIRMQMFRFLYSSFFYLDKLLSDPKTCFSEGSEAGEGCPVLQGEDAVFQIEF
jgi:hypothetical protein